MAVEPSFLYDTVLGGDVRPSPLLLQYFIGVAVLAMVPELPEIVNGIQFALQNNISLRYTSPP